MITKKISPEFKKRFTEEIKRSIIDGKDYYILLVGQDKNPIII